LNFPVTWQQRDVPYEIAFSFLARFSYAVNFRKPAGLMLVNQRICHLLRNGADTMPGFIYGGGLGGSLFLAVLVLRIVAT
jgi:hypothetical protein